MRVSHPNLLCAILIHQLRVVIFYHYSRFTVFGKQTRKIYLFFMLQCLFVLCCITVDVIFKLHPIDVVWSVPASCGGSFSLLLIYSMFKRKTRQRVHLLKMSHLQEIWQLTVAHCYPLCLVVLLNLHSLILLPRTLTIGLLRRPIRG